MAAIIAGDATSRASEGTSHKHASELNQKGMILCSESGGCAAFCHKDRVQIFTFLRNELTLGSTMRLFI